jgi:glycine/D-amino acid oxidase-like deaminating enzyme
MARRDIDTGSMFRRRFLKQLAAAAAVSTAAAYRGTRTRAATRRPLRVGVVGGGILGASLAYHLSEAGARVTLFEKAQPGSGATRNSFAWLNAFVDDPRYRALRLQSLMAYHDLDQRLKLGIVWGGYTHWASTAAEVQSLRETAAQMSATPYPVRPIDAAELIAMTPSLVPGPVAAAFFSRIDGHLNPVEATLRFLDAARQHGAAVMLQCEVQGLDRKHGALSGVRTNQGYFPLDRLIVAGGVDTPSILAMTGFDLKLRHSPGILAHSAPTSRITPIIFDAPGNLSFKQMADGSIVGTDSPEPPDTAVHQEIRARAMAFPDEGLRAMHGNRILTKIAAVLPAAHGVALDRLTLGFRPMPLDELPVVGALPGMPDVYVAVTHSGVTLAPILGRYVAQEALTGSRAEALAPFRPERFAGTIPAEGFDPMRERAVRERAVGAVNEPFAHAVAGRTPPMPGQ